MRHIAMEELCNVIKNSKDKRVVLTFHTIGDRDGVGSAVALSKYFPNSTVITPDFITGNARRMLGYLGMGNAVTEKMPDKPELIVVLDANNLFALGRLKDVLESTKAEILFVDHHAPHKDISLSASMFDDEGYNSTASIITNVFQNIGADVTRDMAVLLLNGISADSAEMQNSSPLTFRQIAELLEIAKLDFSFFTEYFHEVIPAGNKYRVIKDLVAAKHEIVGDYVMIYGRASEHANIDADTALRMNADAAVFWVIGNTEGSVSARLRPPLDKKLSIHLGIIMEDAGKLVGGNGGGHACAAGAYGPKKESAPNAGEEVVRRIKEAMQSHRI